MKIYPFLVLLALLNMSAKNAAAQTMSYYAYDTSKTRIEYPMSRDTFNLFKDSLIIEGKITRYTDLYPQCGTFCTSEKFIMEISKSNPEYNHPLIYVIFICSDEIREDELAHTLKLKLEKIALNENNCLWGKFSNYDSHGLPYYLLTGHSVIK